jgi:hypothetical protein
MANQQIQPWMLMNQPQFSPQDLIVDQSYAAQPQQVMMAPEASMQAPQKTINMMNQRADVNHDVLQELEKSYLESVQNQRAQIEEARTRLQQTQKGPSKLDISPLAALVDTWTGSNLAQYYKRPESKQKVMAELEQALLKSQGQLTETQRQAVKDRMYAQAQLEQIAATKEARLAARDQNKLVKSASQAGKELERDLKVGKEYDADYGNAISGLTDVTSAAQQIKNIINQSGGIPTDPSDPARAQYTKLISDMITGYNRDVAKLGALAGADKELLTRAIGGDVGIVDAYLTNFRGGTPGVIAVLDDLIKAADKKMEENKSRVTNRFSGLADTKFTAQYDNYKKIREVPTLDQKREALRQKRAAGQAQ